MNIKEVQKQYLEGEREIYHRLHGKSLPLKLKNAAIIKLKDILDDPHTYTKYTKDSIFIIAQKVHDPFDGKIIKCHRFHFKKLTPSALKKEIEALNHFFGKPKIPLQISSSITDHKRFLKLGFKTQGVRLVAPIVESLKVIYNLKRELNDGFVFKRAHLSDIPQMIKLEIDVHKHEPSSVIHYNKDSIKEIKLFFQTMIKEKRLWTIVHNKKIIAHIGYGAKEGRGYIGCIAVSRAYQGQQLSYLLYERALIDLQNKYQVKIYTGYTATLKVLKQARKLKRLPYQYIMNN